MKRPLIFGEILFDCFDDGSSVCSGAPLNVCRNLKYLGYEPVMISRVGSDELGNEAIDQLSDIGLELNGVQRDTLHPTSRATVRIKQGEPSYHFTPDSAWDHIDSTQALEAVATEPVDLLYTGTLALRSAVSREALFSLLNSIDAPLFFDANLRTPWWEIEIVNQLLDRARWLKCNKEEYAILFGADTDPQKVCREHQLELVILTLGASGGALHSANSSIQAKPPPLIKPLKDTVGAGDAFATAVLHGINQGQPAEQILAEALDLSARVCTFQGADWQ